MPEDEKDDKELAAELQEKMKVSGETVVEDDTFAILPGEGVVLFIINHLPGKDKDKSLAMQLPPTLAVSLGHALVNGALLSKDLEEEGEREKTSLPPIQEEVKKEFLN